MNFTEYFNESLFIDFKGLQGGLKKVFLSGILRRGMGTGRVHDQEIMQAIELFKDLTGQDAVKVAGFSPLGASPDKRQQFFKSLYDVLYGHQTVGAPTEDEPVPQFA